jgi:hypothetical protein
LDGVTNENYFYKIVEKVFTNLFLKNQLAKSQSMKLVIHPWVKEIQVCSNKEPGLLQTCQRRNKHKNAK